MGPVTGEALVDIPGGPGTYALVMRLEAAAEVAVGRLAPAAFPAGWYIYVGSALGGLRGRLARHLRPSKRRHWHIDYLTPPAEIIEIWCATSPERLECGWARALCSLPAAEPHPARFGCSDCRCATHLVFFRERPGLQTAGRLLPQGATVLCVPAR